VFTFQSIRTLSGSNPAVSGCRAGNCRAGTTTPPGRCSWLYRPRLLRGTVTAGATSKTGTDDEQREAVRAEGFDPDDTPQGHLDL